MLRLAQILLTITAIQYSVLPLAADLNPTHLFHEDWPPHARFHLTWALATGTAVALYILALVWGPVQDQQRSLMQASLFGLVVPLGFFAATLSLDVYDGALTDQVDGPKILGIDGNLLSISIAFMLQLTAAALVRKSDHPPSEIQE